MYRLVCDECENDSHLYMTDSGDIMCGNCLNREEYEEEAQMEMVLVCK
jgi:hypothetical protein